MQKEAQDIFSSNEEDSNVDSKIPVGSQSQGMVTRVTTPVGTNFVITVIIMSSRFHITLFIVCTYLLHENDNLYKMFFIVYIPLSYYN